MGWNERLVTWFTVCTIIMLVYAVTTHSWILVESNGQVYYSGMWKVCLKLVCTGLIDIAPNVEGARTLLVLALFSSILGASFMTFTYRYSPDAMINRYLVSAMGSLIAAALVFLALSIYTIRISTHGISRTGKITYLPPFYVAWASCPSFILSGLFALMAHQRLLMQGPTLPDGESTMSSSSSDWITSSSSFLDTESESTMSQRQDKQSVGTKVGSYREATARDKTELGGHLV